MGRKALLGGGENGRCILFFLEWMNGIFPKAVCGMRTKAVSGELGEGRKEGRDRKRCEAAVLVFCCLLLLTAPPAISLFPLSPHFQSDSQRKLENSQN
jgi:hypothetical protein